MCADPKKIWVKQAVRIVRYGTLMISLQMFEERGVCKVVDHRLARFFVLFCFVFCLSVVEFLKRKFELDYENKK